MVVAIHSLRDGSTDTLYAFEYWTDAQDWSWWEWPAAMYYQHFNLESGDEEQVKLAIVIFTVGGCCLLTCLCCCLYCCCAKCFASRDKVMAEVALATE